MKSLFFLCLLLSAQTLYSQSLSLFDIDASNFPVMRAKFYALDSNGNQIRPESKDLILKENGVERKEKSISCPALKTPQALSSVLVIDVSGSMQGLNITLAKAAATVWITVLPLGKSECAITSFDDIGYLNQDFTTDKAKLSSAINQLVPKGSTDYDAGLITPMAGGLLISKRGNYKKVIVFLTDGSPDRIPRVDDIVKEANEQNCAIYCISLGMAAPSSLHTISTKTGGKVYEKVKSITEIENIYQMILVESQGSDPCTIEWKTDVLCISAVTTNVELSYTTENAEGRYNPPPIVAALEFSPPFVLFDNPIIGKAQTREITVTARNAPFKVTDIASTHPNFSISPKSFTILPDESKTLTLTFTPTTMEYVYSDFTVKTDVCQFQYYASGGTKGGKPKIPTIRVTHPNGGEVFVVGGDSIITWTGVAAHSLVRLEYSTDNGVRWKNIDTARGLEYIWNNIPPPASSQCLVRVKQLEGIDVIGELFQTLTDHNLDVKALASTNLLVSGSYDGKLKAWDIYSGKLLQTVIADSGGGGIYSIAMNKSGAIAVGGGAKIISLWSEKIQKLRTLSAHEHAVLGLAFSPDGKTLASGSADNSVKLWNVQTGAEIPLILRHTSWVTCVTFNPGGTILASGSYDNTIKWWNPQTGMSINQLRGHTDYVHAIAFSPDGTKFASASKDGTLKIWDGQDGRLLRTMQGHHDGAYSIVFSPDGRLLISAGEDAVIKIWDINTYTLKNTLYGHKEAILSLTISQNGKMLASGSQDNTIKLWNMDEVVFQIDSSDAVFSIVQPQAASHDIHMGRVGIGMNKDSIITGFIGNTGNYPFDVQAITIVGTHASAFSIVSGTPPIRIMSGNKHDIEFRFTPEFEGLHTAQIHIITQSDTLRQIIKGEGVRQSLRPMGSIIDFGMVEVGKSKDTIKVMTVKNVDNVPLTILNTSHGKPNSTDFITLARGGYFTIPPDEIHTMDFRFIPSDTGRTSGTVEFHYNGVGSPLIIQLFGEGIRKRAKIVRPSLHIDTLICANESALPVSVKNRGNDVLIIDSLNVSGVHSGEFILQQSLPLRIEPDSVHNIMVRLRPQSQGTKSAILHIHSNAESDTIISVPLSMQKEYVSVKTPSIIDLGILCPGETKDFFIPCTNDGSIPVQTTVTEDRDVNIISGVHTLNVGMKDSLLLHFSGLYESGSFSRMIRISDNCGIVHTVQVKGIIDSSHIVTDSIVNLGILCPDETRDFMLFFQNNGKIPVQMIINGDKDIQAVSGVKNIDVGKKDSLLIHFSGLQEFGNFRRTVSFTDNCGVARTIHITGTVDFPLKVSQSIVISAQLGQKEKSQITVNNVTNRDIIIYGIKGIQEPFSLIGNPFPFVVQAQSQKDIEVEFSPSGTIPVIDTIQLQTNTCIVAGIIQLHGITTLSSSGIVKTFHVSGYAGEEIEIPIQLISQENIAQSGITSIDMDLSFNPTLLSPIGYTVEIINDTLGKISMKNIPIIAESGKILHTIRCIVGLGNAEQCSLDLSNLTLYGGTANINIVNGKFILLGICEEGGTRLINPGKATSLMRIHPNPSKGIMSVDLELIEQGLTKVRIMDIQGNVMVERELIDSIGSTTVLFDMEKYGAGVYYIEVRTPTIVRKEKIMIEK